MDIEQQIQSEVESSAAQTAPSETTEQSQATSEPKTETTENTTQTEVQPKEDFYKSQYENLQKDYTRKAQKLAELEKTNEPKPEPEKQAWEDPNWQPKTWAEVREAAKAEALKELSPVLSEYQQAQQQREIYSQAQQVVDRELSEIKELDPRLDENILFKYANEAKAAGREFSNLKSAYKDMVDRRNLEKTIEQRVLKNLKQRGLDPIATGGTTNSPVDDTESYQEISSHKSIYAAARAALARTKGK